MNNMKKRVFAALLAAAMTLPAFACGEKINSGDDSSSKESSISQDESSAENSESNPDESSAEKKNDNSSQEASEDPEDSNIVIDPNGGRNQKLTFETPQNIDEADTVVSTIRGDDGKIYAAKTDINGAAVTEANGSAVTELYTGPTNAAEYEKGYTPGIKTYQAYWLDISEQKDFVFDGNLLEFEVKVNENTPDGIYPIEVYFADLSNYSANTDENADKLNNVKFRPGYVCVNKAKPEIPALGKEMTLTPDTVSAKPGESVRVNVRVDNNPGLVAFVIRMHFDNNAMSISKGGAGSDLGDVALLTARTLD